MYLRHYRRGLSAPLCTVVACIAGVLVGTQLFTVLRLGATTRKTSVREIRSLRMTATEAAGLTRSPVDLPAAASEAPPSRKLLYVGVMTADQFLHSRAVAVHETWGSTVPNSHEFFTSEKSGGPPNVPIVRLKSVTDQYPPQKKSFMMLKYMYEHYGDQYEWFMRADDDVYIRTDRLEKLLRGVNSSQPMFIGQAGQGNKAEIGLLSLDQKDNYCMGGPGIVMSQATLARIYPHIRYCLANLYTTHEDVEVGRCVKKFAGVSCLWNYEMKEIFFHHPLGTNGFTSSLKSRSILNAITLHPIKTPPLLYKLHYFFMSEKIKEAQMMKVVRHRQIVRCTDEQDMHKLSPLTRRLGKPPMLNKYPVTNTSEVQAWSHMGYRFSISSVKVYDPRINAAMHLREGVRDATSSLMDYMLSFTQERGRSLSLQDHNYGYHRVDPLYGVDMVLDLVLKYYRFRGKPMSQKVRRHAYLQQPFGEPEVRVVKRQERGVVVNLVVGLAGKLKPFFKFCDNVEKMGLDNLRIVFVYHENADPVNGDQIVHKLQQLQEQHGESVSVVTTAQQFDRASSLMLGASVLADDDIIFFMDIDILVNEGAIDSVRQFVVQGKQVYFPVVFSEYDPDSGFMEAPMRDADHFVVDAERGKFRFYGFGICAMYKSDLKAVGGLNQEIHGWGKEDVDLVERVLNHPANYTIIRAADLGMVHVYHLIHCSEELSAEQTVMCHGTRNSFLASKRSMAWQVCLDERVLQFARSLPKS